MALCPSPRTFPANPITMLGIDKQSVGNMGTLPMFYLDVG